MRWRRVAVRGPSMSPTLGDGDVVLVRFGAPVRAGDVVLVTWRAPPGQLSVKRAVRREGDGWWGLGDNPYGSTDSRTLGPPPAPPAVPRRPPPPRPRRGARRGPPPPLAASRPAAPTGQAGGRWMVKPAPPSGAGAASIRPPIRCTMACARARPTPPAPRRSR